MNVIWLREILTERYNTHFLGLRNKLTSRSKPGSVCSYCNNLPSRPVGHTMQKSLKLKLQNALTQNSLADANSPAIFVGGRRRNRKKRKNRINGPVKRRNKRDGNESLVTSPSTPATSYEDAVPIYAVKKPLVSCLDIEEPVFSYKPVTSPSHVTEDDNDSMYYSNESLISFKSELDAFKKQIDDLENTENVMNQSQLGEVTQDNSELATKIGYPRTISEDSGVFDDASVVDAGYDDAFVDDFDSSEEDMIDNSPSENLTYDDIFTDEGNDTANEDVDASTTESTPSTESLNEFDEIGLTDDIHVETPSKRKLVPQEHETYATQDDDEDIVPDIKIVREVADMKEADPFFKFVTEDGEDDIIFDLSLLEVNNTQENISSIKQEILLSQLNKALNDPTDLEEEIPLKVPMDLLIDDDDNDEVLFEAGHRKELSITCNPLYEQALKEEDDKFSVQSYQSGFKTNFDNINVIQIPVPASDKATHKSLKESSPLIKRRPPGGDRDDEMACCIIL